MADEKKNKVYVFILRDEDGKAMKKRMFRANSRTRRNFRDKGWDISLMRSTR